MVLVLSTSSRSDAKCGYVMTCLGGWFKKTFQGLHPLPNLFTPKGLRLLKVAVLQKSSCPFADLYQYLYVAAKCIEKGV